MNVIAVADKIFVELGHKKRGGYVAGFSGNEVREKRIMNSEVAVSLTLQRVMRTVWTPAFLNAL